MILDKVWHESCPYDYNDLLFDIFRYINYLMKGSKIIKYLDKLTHEMFISMKKRITWYQTY